MTTAELTKTTDSTANIANNRLEDTINHLGSRRQQPSEAFLQEKIAEAKVGFGEKLLAAFNKIPAAIASAMRISHSTLTFWQKGKNLPNGEALIVIYYLTGVNPAYMLGLSDQKFLGRSHVLSPFSLGEIETIQDRASLNNRTVEEEIKALALAGLEAVKSYEK